MAEFQDEFVYRAYVQDDTGKFFARFDKFADNYRQKASSAFSASTKGANASALALGALGGVVAGLTTKLLEMGTALLRNIPQFIEQATELAARVEVLELNVNRIGERMGYSAEQTQKTVDSLKDLGITTQGAYNSLLLLSRANIDWSEATTLARVAQDSAVIAGMNSSQAFERLARGIQKMEPELLDELGITLRRSDAYARLAQELGKNAKELTDVEQKQAILNEIYRQSGVVAGSYEASLETAGKRASSMARHIEELQLAIGEAFLPVHRARIDIYTNALKQLKQFVDENKEGIAAFGRILGEGLERTGKVLLGILKLILTLVTAVSKLSNKFKEFTSSLIGDDNLQQLSDWWKAFLKLIGIGISVVVGGVNAAIQGISTIVKTAANNVQSLAALIRGELSLAEFTSQVKTNNSELVDLGQIIKDGFNDGQQAAAEFLGVLDELEPSTDAASESLDDMANSGDNSVQMLEDLTQATNRSTEAQEAARRATENLRQAQEALDQIREQYARSEEDRLRQEMRQQIEDALQLSHQREDIERRHQDSLQQIRENAAEQQQDLLERAEDDLVKAEEDRADARIRVEQDYQKRLEQIRRDFLYDATQLAEQRDAIGLVNLIRSTQRKLEEEERARNENLQGVEEDYQERQQELEENLAEQQQQIEDSLAEQLAAADEAREQDYENLNRQLDRQRELKNLHDQWAAEDRSIALQRQLQDWMEQYSQLEGVTQQSLQNMLGDWQSYMTGVQSTVSSGMSNIQTLLNGQSGGASGAASGPSTPVMVNQPGGATGAVGGSYQQDLISLPGGSTSQISSLAGNSSVQNYINSLQGAAQPLRTVNRNETAVSVDGSGLDPYIQQLVADMLMQMEQG